MASVDKIRINGRYFSRSNVIIKINGFRFEEIVSIKYGRKRNRGNPVRRLDTANSIAGHVDGQVEYSPVVIVMRLEAIQVLEEMLTVAGLGSPGAARVTITITYLMLGKSPIVVSCEGCAYNGGDDDEVPEDAGVAISSAVEFSPTKIKKNGIALEELTSPV